MPPATITPQVGGRSLSLVRWCWPPRYQRYFRLVIWVRGGGLGPVVLLRRSRLCGRWWSQLVVAGGGAGCARSLAASVAACFCCGLASCLLLLSCVLLCPGVGVVGHPLFARVLGRRHGFVAGLLCRARRWLCLPRVVRGCGCRFLVSGPWGLALLLWAFVSRWGCPWLVSPGCCNVCRVGCVSGGTARCCCWVAVWFLVWRPSRPCRPGVVAAAASEMVTSRGPLARGGLLPLAAGRRSCC